LITAADKSYCAADSASLGVVSSASSSDSSSMENFDLISPPGVGGWGGEEKSERYRVQIRYIKRKLTAIKFRIAT